MDFFDLKLIYSFINVLMAVNPAGYNLTKLVEIMSPLGSNVFNKQLFTRHRNSYQIAMVLAHINKFYKYRNIGYKCLGAENDTPLDASNLPSGPLPIWIQRSQETTDEEVLEYLNLSFLQGAKNVTLVHSFQKQFSQEAKSWLDQEKFKVLEFEHMTGSETDNLVAFIEHYDMEVFSRAKKHLIVVTR